MTDEFVGHDEYGRPVFQDAAGDMYVLDSSDQDITGDPRYSQLTDRLAQLEGMVAEQDAAAEKEQAISELEQYVENLLDAYGVPENQRDIIVSRAVALPTDENGLPDVEGAVTEMNTVQAAEHSPPPMREFPEEGSRSDIVDWQVERAGQLEKHNADREQLVNAYHPSVAGSDDDPWDSMTQAQRTEAMVERMEAHQ